MVKKIFENLCLSLSNVIKTLRGSLIQPGALQDLISGMFYSSRSFRHVVGI